MVSEISPVPVRMPGAVREWLKSRADENLRSMNSEIVALLMAEKRRQDEKNGGGQQ